MTANQKRRLDSLNRFFQKIINEKRLKGKQETDEDLSIFIERRVKSMKKNLREMEKRIKALEWKIE